MVLYRINSVPVWTIHLRYTIRCSVSTCPARATVGCTGDQPAKNMPNERLPATTVTHKRHAEVVYAFDEGSDGEVADSEEEISEAEISQEEAPADAQPVQRASIDLTADSSSGDDSDVEVLGGDPRDDTGPDAPRTRGRQRLVYTADLPRKLAQAQRNPHIMARSEPMLCPFISRQSPQHLICVSRAQPFWLQTCKDVHLIPLDGEVKRGVVHFCRHCKNLVGPEQLSAPRCPHCHTRVKKGQWV